MEKIKIHEYACPRCSLAISVYIDDEWATYLSRSKCDCKFEYNHTGIVGFELNDRCYIELDVGFNRTFIHTNNDTLIINGLLWKITQDRIDKLLLLK